MADSEPVTPRADAPTPATPEPAKVEEKEPVLDRDRPLSQQVDKVLALLPKEGDDVKPEEKKPEEPAKEPKKAPEAENPTPEDAGNEVEDEAYQEPVELPAWQQYVLEKLPDIQTFGHVEGKKDKVYTVKRLEDLPADFEFSDKRTELSFTQALASQELNARQLVQDYNQEQQQSQYQKLKNQEAVEVQADIVSLQKEGVLEKFKYKDTDPEFNDDPAVKTANEIYDVMDKTNAAYIRKGLTYRISYADAADKYFARRSRTAPKEAKPEEKPNKEREQVAAKVSAPQGASPQSNRRGIPSGATMADVYRAYKIGAI